MLWNIFQNQMFLHICDVEGPGPYLIQWIGALDRISRFQFYLHSKFIEYLSKFNLFLTIVILKVPVHI